jgi:hypothetical protein
VHGGGSGTATITITRYIKDRKISLYVDMEDICTGLFKLGTLLLISLKLSEIQNGQK